MSPEGGGARNSGRPFFAAEVAASSRVEQKGGAQYSGTP
jgi:hypothetical protein